MTIHLKKIALHPERYPTDAHYPFNNPLFRETNDLVFDTPVTFFIGENGAGKSTLLEALANKCGIHIWRDVDKRQFEGNPYQNALYLFLSAEWSDGVVKGSFFSSEIFRDFAQNLDEWASADPMMLKYFGGKSLVTQSHGESLMSYFRARYQIKGLYLMDEPETALSPKSQLGLVQVLKEMSGAGHAQFIIASHSPILLACPGAKIYSFDSSPVKRIDYEDTEYYRVYKAFMEDRTKFI